MNISELKEWLKDADTVHSDEDVDGSCNRLETRVYQRDGKYYRLEFCNGHLSEKWGEKGYIRGVYEPIEVFRKDVEVIETFYFTKEEME